MKILNFIEKLLPRLEKQNILEDLRITLSELDTIVIPSYQAASEYFKSAKLKADANQELSTLFYRNASLIVRNKQPTMVNEAYLFLKNLRENTAYISDQIEALMEMDVIPAGLTAKKALLIRAAEAVSFASRFAPELLSVVYSNEAVENGAEISESVKVVPAVINNVNKNISKFAGAISDYGVPNDRFTKIISAVPDVVVGGKAGKAVAGLYKEDEVDPFSSNYVAGFTYSPIYHFRLMVAEWQASRYKANKDKKKVLELRLLHLKMQADKKSDARLEQEINYLQGRIDKIERYLKSVEEDLGE